MKWQPDRAEESVIFYLINYEVSLSVITFHFENKQNSSNTHKKDMKWITDCISLSGREWNKMSDHDSEPTVHVTLVLNWLNNWYKHWQSASFGVTSLFILFTGIVPTPPTPPNEQNNATPCGVSTLLQRLNQPTEEVKRQGTTTGDASCYGAQRAAGCLIWPFVCAAAYSSAQNSRGEDKPVSSSTRCIASSRPRSHSCSCMPLFWNVHHKVRRCTTPTSGIACSQPATWCMC